MATFSEALRDAIKFTYCAALGAGNAIWRWVSTLTFGADSVEAREGFRRWAGLQLCSAPPPEPAPPFTGGQCPTLYRISYVVSYNPIGRPNDIRTLSDTITGYYGKIRYPYPKDPDPASPALKSFYFLSGTANNPNAQVENFLAGVNRTSFENITLTSFTVARVDNQPDTCGNVPPVLTPYNPNDWRFPVNVTFDPPSGPPITIPVVLAFGLAYFKADLNVHIPVDININPNFSFNPNFNFNFRAEINVGNGDINIGPPRGVDRPPPIDRPPVDYDIDIDLPPGGPPPQPPDVPTPPPDVDRDPGSKVIRGCVVTVATVNEESNIGVLGQDDNPDVYYPDLGLVSFQIQLANGIYGWTEDIRVKNKRAFITCPWPGGAVGVRGTPRTGTTFSITPVYGYPEPEVK